MKENPAITINTEQNIRTDQLIEVIPFLRGIMNISTAELKIMADEDPWRAARIAHNQQRVDHLTRLARNGNKN